MTVPEPVLVSDCCGAPVRQLGDLTRECDGCGEPCDGSSGTPLPDAAVTADLPDDLPPGAVDLAAWAIHRLASPGDPCGCTIEGEHEGSFAADLDAASEAVWAAYPLIAAQGAAAARTRFLAVLAEHYLMMVICNEDTHQDNPVCGCSRVFLGWHPSIGAARQAYIDHVAAVLDGDGDP